MMEEQLYLKKVSTVLKGIDPYALKFYWEITNKQNTTSGICVEDASTLQFSPLGLSFSFWIQVDQSLLKEHGRHLIYRLQTGPSSFFEAFVAKDGTLIVAVMTEKLYTTSLLVETSLNDGKWHSVLVVHAAGRGLISSSQLRVSLDGVEQHVALMKFPKIGTLRVLHIGAIGDPTTQTLETLAGRNEGLRTFQGFGLSQTTNTYFSLPVGLRSFDPRSSSVRAVASGLEEYVWGPVRAFPGKLAAFSFVREPLTSLQCKRLHTAGPTFRHLFSSNDSTNIDVSSKCSFAIAASASDGDVLLELSSGKNLAGKQGVVLKKQEGIQELLFSNGGLLSLLPILEYSVSKRVEAVPDLLSYALPNLNPTSEVAEFFNTLSLLFFHHESFRQEAVNSKFFESLAVIFCQIRPELLDEAVFESVQRLNQSLQIEKPLEQTFVLGVMCNFKPWKKASFDLRLLHLEHLTSLVRRDRRFFRHHFGVQAFLDALRLYFPSDNSPEAVTLRNGVLKIVRYFLERDAHFAEVTAVLHHILAQRSAHLVCEVAETLYTALESPKCNDQLYLLLFEPKCSELLYGILPEFDDNVMKSVMKVLHVLLKSHRVYTEDKKRLYLNQCGFGGLFSTLPSVELSEKSAGKIADVLLSTECPDSNYAGFLAFCAKLSVAPLRTKLVVAKKMLDHLVSTPGAAKFFASQVDWAGCLLRLLIKQGSGEIIPAKCRAPSTLSFSTPSTPTPQNPLRSPWRTVGGIIGTAIEVTSQIGLPVQEGHVLEGDNQSVEGSFDASFDCLGGEEGLDDGSVRECGSPSSASLDDNLAGPSADENEEERSPREEPSVEEHLLLVTTSVGVILTKGLEGAEPLKEAWRVLSSVDILTEANIFYCDPKRIKTQMIAVFGQSAVRWVRDDPTPGRALQILKWLYAATELGSNHEGSLIILELGLQIMDMFKLLHEEFDQRKITGITEILHASLGLLVFYISSSTLDVCSLACVRLHQFLNARGALIDNLMASFVLYHVGVCSTDTVIMNQEHQYSFLLPVLKTLLNLNGASTFLPSVPDGSLNLDPTFYDEFKSIAITPAWDRYLNDVVRQSHDLFHAIYLSSLELQLRQLADDCNEDAAVAWHMHCRQVGESKLRFMTEVLTPLKAEREQERKRFQLSYFRQKHVQCLAQRRWQEQKESLKKPKEDSDSVTNWKQVPSETFCRVRPKMTPNTAFDDHTEASRLRDETGPVSPKTLEPNIQIPKKDSNYAGSQDSEEELEPEQPVEVEEIPAVSQGRIFRPVACERITIFGSEQGTLQVTESMVMFSVPKEDHLEIPIWMIREIYSRRYCLQRTAMEMFLLDNTNFFFNLEGKTANQVYLQIRSLRPTNLISRYGFDVVPRNQLTQQWQRREISNFEYLMALNTASGRTFNDLAQYPVLPWVIGDYSSEEMDLEDPTTFRDLSKPVGALSAKNRDEVKKKFDTFEDPTGLASKFHYGSHYSSPAVVTHYLVRMEPFTSLHIDLQGGRFDIADRQFVSLPGAWRSIVDSASDVKELIPEFFTTPDIFRNENSFNLGKLQGSSTPVNDVELPKWAPSPEGFVARHREAMESEYVSRNLNSWISLIFGHKQKGPQAADALNVFYYSSYEDAVNLDLITDDKEKIAVMEMIRHFGQTPVQLFRFPHPPRVSLDDLKLLWYRNANIRRPSILEIPKSLCSFVQSFSEQPVPFVWMSFPNRARPLMSSPANNDPNHLFCLSTRYQCYVHRLVGSTKCSFEREELSTKLEPGRRLPLSLHPSLALSAELHALSPDGKFLFVAGNWDSSFRIFSVSRGKELRLEHTVNSHLDVVTCVAVDRIGLYAVTGSTDRTCIVWSVSELTGLQPSRDHAPKRLSVLIGHNSPVIAVAISTELDTVVSAGSDGTILLHSVKTGVYQSTVKSPFAEKLAVEKLVMGEEGDLAVVYRNQIKQYSLCTFTVNGKALASRRFSRRLSTLIVGKRHLLIADLTGNLKMLETWSLKMVSHFSFPEAVLSVAATPSWTYFAVSLRDGSLVVVEPDLTPRKKSSIVDV